MSQAWGQKEPMTQEGIDALTTVVVYLDTRMDEEITLFLDMMSRGGEIMWLQGEEGEENRERVESPSGGRSSGAIVELADAVGLDLLESEAGDSEDEVMEDDLPPVQGIPEAVWESLKGLRDSKHAPTNVRLDGEAWTGEARDEESGARTHREEKEGKAKGLWEMGTHDSRKAGDVLDDILHQQKRNYVWTTHLASRRIWRPARQDATVLLTGVLTQIEAHLRLQRQLKHICATTPIEGHLHLQRSLAPDAWS